MPSDTNAIPTADAELLLRVQQLNQREIVEELLHDLRNPVHSIRVTIELFGRLATNTGNSEMLARAARYAAPAQSAVTALVAQTERLSTYLAPPARPAIGAVAVNEWLAELAGLFKDAHVTVQSELGDDQSLLADRPRVSHAVLRWLLDRSAAPLTVQAREDGDRLTVAVSVARDDEAFNASVTRADLKILIENAGGEVAAETDRSLSVSFGRAISRAQTQEST